MPFGLIEVTAKSAHRDTLNAIAVWTVGFIALIAILAPRWLLSKCGADWFFFIIRPRSGDY